MNALVPIVAATREELSRRRHTVPIDVLERAAARRAASDPPRPFLQALSAPGLSLIAEHKRRSPSAGAIREGIELAQIVRAYERGGASALSILTEGPSFGGSLEDLRSARAASALPILRKDFIVDPYQLQEALVFGADAILLIVAALSQPELNRLHAEALALGLVALVEVHDEDELGRALATGAQLIGINNRDLTTLRVDTRRTFELLSRLGPGPGPVVVAESGFSRPDELEELARARVDAVLVGEALMRSAEIEAATRALTARPQVSAAGSDVPTMGS